MYVFLFISNCCNLYSTSDFVLFLIAQKVLVEVSFATVIVSIVLCVHLYVRDWAEEGGEEETQRLQVAVQEIRESAMEPTVATA